MGEYLDQLQASYRFRPKVNGQAAFTKKQSKKAKTKLRKRKRRTVRLLNTSGIQKAELASSIAKEAPCTPTPTCPPLWLEENEGYLKQLGAYRTSKRQRKQLIKKHFADEWQSSWDRYWKKHDRPYCRLGSPTTRTGKTESTRQPGQSRKLISSPGSNRENRICKLLAPAARPSYNFPGLRVWLALNDS